MAIIFVLMGENGRLCQEHVHFDVETGSTMMKSFVVVDPPIAGLSLVLFWLLMVTQRPSTLAIRQSPRSEICKANVSGTEKKADLGSTGQAKLRVGVKEIFQSRGLGR